MGVPQNPFQICSMGTGRLAGRSILLMPSWRRKVVTILSRWDVTVLNTPTPSTPTPHPHPHPLHPPPPPPPPPTPTPTPSTPHPTPTPSTPHPTPHPHPHPHPTPGEQKVAVYLAEYPRAVKYWCFGCDLFPFLKSVWSIYVNRSTVFFSRLLHWLWGKCHPCADEVTWGDECKYKGSLLLTWFNFNPSMEK